AKRAVAMTDVTSIGNKAWAVGNSTRRRDSTPIVQTCTLSACRRAALPKPGGRRSVVTSVSAASASDIWAGGFDTNAHGVQRPVWWRFKGGRWDIFDVAIPNEGIESIAIIDLDVANKSK